MTMHYKLFLEKRIIFILKEIKGLNGGEREGIQGQKFPLLLKIPVFPKLIIE